MLRAQVGIVGLGIAGSAIAATLASSGYSVVGWDQHGPHHDLGSSHGSERLLRLGHVDSRLTVAAWEALQLWRQLEATTGTRLLRPSSTLDIGFLDEIESIQSTLTAVGLASRMLDGSDLRGLRPTGLVLETSEGAVIFAKEALDTFRTIATDSQAHLAFNCPVQSSIRRNDHLEIATEGGTWQVDHLVLATGAWPTETLLPENIAKVPQLRVTDELVAYFEPTARIAQIPPTIFRQAERHYVMPHVADRLFKIAEHHSGPVVSPTSLEREDPTDRLHRLAAWVSDRVPGVTPKPLSVSRCLYATLPNEDFLVERFDDVTVALGLSGHGFKFAPVIAKTVAGLIGGAISTSPFGQGSGHHATGRSVHK